MSWAQRLKRVFNIDVNTCIHCGGAGDGHVSTGWDHGMLRMASHGEGPSLEEQAHLQRRMDAMLWSRAPRRHHDGFEADRSYRELVQASRKAHAHTACTRMALTVPSFGLAHGEAGGFSIVCTSSGQALDTSKHNYTLTFPAGQLPPVNAFWSVTMYDGKSQLLIENPIDRYLINAPMLPDMQKDADGSLTLYIQKDSPGKDKEANWLPAPDGEAFLVMRLYWPRTEAPSILPPGEGSWQPPGIVVAQ